MDEIIFFGGGVFFCLFETNPFLHMNSHYVICKSSFSFTFWWGTKLSFVHCNLNVGQVYWVVFFLRKRKNCDIEQQKKKYIYKNELQFFLFFFYVFRIFFVIMGFGTQIP